MFTKKSIPMCGVMIRSSLTCPPVFRRQITRSLIVADFAPITVSNQNVEETDSGDGCSVMLVGGGRVGQILANKMIPIFNIKNLTIVDRDRAQCRGLFAEIRAKFPRTAILGIICDINTQHRVQEAFQKAIYHSNGLLDIIVDATNFDGEASHEDTMTPSTMALQQFQRKCLDKLSHGGQFANFNSYEYLPPSLYNDPSILHYRHLSIENTTEVKRSDFVKTCLDTIQRSRDQRRYGKVMCSFSRPRLLIDD